MSSSLVGMVSASKQSSRSAGSGNWSNPRSNGCKKDQSVTKLINKYIHISTEYTCLPLNQSSKDLMLFLKLQNHRAPCVGVAEMTVASLVHTKQLSHWLVAALWMNMMKRTLVVVKLLKCYYWFEVRSLVALAGWIMHGFLQ